MDKLIKNVSELTGIHKSLVVLTDDMIKFHLKIESAKLEGDLKEMIELAYGMEGDELEAYYMNKHFDSDVGKRDRVEYINTYTQYKWFEEVKRELIGYMVHTEEFWFNVYLSEWLDNN